MAQNATDKKAKKGGLFDDLSFPQVIAGALAAVTSMLLASQIGIYGSVIGVGVGSVVSAVASQLYKKFLQRSAEKLRELKPGEPGFGQQEADAGGGAAGSGIDEGDTVSLGPIGDMRKGTPTPSLEDASMQGDATVRRVRVEREHKKKVQRGVVIVSVVSAVLAVLVSGGVVYWATQGEGVGAKTNPIVSAVRQSPPKATDDGSSSSAEGEASSSGDSSDGSSGGQSGTDGSKGSSDGASSESGDGGQQGSGATGSGGASGSDSGQSGGSTGSGGAGGADTGSGAGAGSGSGSGSPDSGSSGSSPGGSADSGGSSSSGPSGSGSGGASGTSGSEDASGSGASSASDGSPASARAAGGVVQAAA